MFYSCLSYLSTNTRDSFEYFHWKKLQNLLTSYYKWDENYPWSFLSPVGLINIIAVGYQIIMSLCGFCTLSIKPRWRTLNYKMAALPQLISVINSLRAASCRCTTAEIVFGGREGRGCRWSDVFTPSHIY